MTARLSTARARGDAIEQVGVQLRRTLGAFVDGSEAVRRVACCEDRGESARLDCSWRSVLPGCGALLIVVGGMWCITAANLMSGEALAQVGIKPRNVPWGLVGIIAAPWVHLSVSHIGANSGPFLVLGAFVMMRGMRAWLAITIWIVLVGGFMLWVVGPPHTVHDGCSSLVFGYMGFLLAAALVECRPLPLLSALVAVAAYGGCLMGALPSASAVRDHVSWEGHLTGLAAGIALVLLHVVLRAACGERCVAARLGERGIAQHRLSKWCCRRRGAADGFGAGDASRSSFAGERRSGGGGGGGGARWTARSRRGVEGQQYGSVATTVGGGSPSKERRGVGEPLRGERAPLLTAMIV